MPDIQTELKPAKDTSAGQLRRLAQETLTQIEEKQYDTVMKSRNISPVFKCGVTFSGKNAEIAKK